MKTNLKAWASVALTTFTGAAVAYFAMPHAGATTRDVLIGAALAGASAVIHLFQRAKVEVPS